MHPKYMVAVSIMEYDSQGKQVQIWHSSCMAESGDQLAAAGRIAVEISNAPVGKEPVRTKR